MKTPEQNKLEETKAIIKMTDNYKVKLPEINYIEYKVLIKALEFYKMANLELSLDENRLIDIYVLIDRIQNYKEIVEIKN